MDSETGANGLKRLMERMTAAGVVPDINQFDLSEQRAVYCVLRRRLSTQQPQPERGAEDEAR
jgi:hypothetical protein